MAASETRQENDMTEMPIEHAAHAAVSPPPQPPRPPTMVARISHDLAAAGDVLARMAPVLEAIAACPPADEAVELLREAARLGADARDLAPVSAVLRDLIARLAREAARQNGTGPQPAFTAAHAEDAEPHETGM